MHNVWVHVAEESRDRYAVVSRLVALGLVGAVALALLGLPPTSLHGPLHRFGIMDPLCGMTRAVRLLARGNVAATWRYNPAAFALAIFAALIMLRWVFGRFTGRWYAVTLASPRVLRLALALPVAALWANQQAHAALLK